MPPGGRPPPRATALLTAAILLFAWRQVSEAKRLREEQARPFVVVDFAVDWLTDLTIENLGTTVAHDVTIKFDPPLESTLGRPWAWEDSTLFIDGIPTLVPGKRIAVSFDAINSRFDSDLPLSYKAEVSYRGLRKKRITDHYVLDLAIYKGTTPPEKGVPELVAAVKNMHQEMKKWTDGVSGLRVNSADRDRSSRRETRYIWIQRAKQVQRDDGLVAGLRHLARRALLRRGWVR